MLFQKIVIKVDRIEYENDRRILVECEGSNVWLRKSKIRIIRDDDVITIELSKRYYKEKFGPA